MLNIAYLILTYVFRSQSALLLAFASVTITLGQVWTFSDRYVWYALTDLVLDYFPMYSGILLSQLFDESIKTIGYIMGYGDYVSALVASFLLQWKMS